MKTGLRLVLCLVILVGLISAITAVAQLPDKKVLTLAGAKQLAAAAAAEAVKNKWNVVIAIVDDGGSLIYLERLDDTQIGSIDVAIQKAQTAVNFKRPSKMLEEALVEKGRTPILKLPGGIPIEGGLPIVVNDKVIGGIGVSGVTAQQDGQIAKAGVDALPKVLGQ